MGRANIRSGDETIKYLMANSMAINLDMLGMFMKSRIVGNKKIIVCDGYYVAYKPITLFMYLVHVH